jgi:bla regulator protein BlaR1
MPALFVFLIKVNAALLLFCAGYYLVLRPLTFYSLNRVYLVAAILFASVYPKINLSGFAERHQQLSKPVQAVVINFQTPARALIKPFARPDYWQWIEIIFWAGTVVLVIRLLTQLYSLFQLYRHSKPSKICDHDVRTIEGNAGPFSFWRSIYINPANHAAADLESILLHEQVHVNEWHTLDILLAELSTIFYWFNPGVWLMKKAVRENIEFITDQKILKKGVDTKQYQYSLVNVSFAASPNPIVNHFNISTIKRRIIMMNAKRSSTFNLTRYALLVPAVVALLLVFSISKAALATKSHYAYKALTTTVHNLTKTITLHASGRPTATQHIQRPKMENVAANAILKIIDTVKNGNVSIGTTEKTDSLTYVVNGVKMKKADFKNLDPDKIYSIEILTGEQANKLLDEIDGKHNVLFVTTKDSEEGKKFKEKIDELNDHSFTISSNFKTSRPDNNFEIDGQAQKLAIAASRIRANVDRRKKLYKLDNVDGKWMITDDTRPVIVADGNDSLLISDMKMRKDFAPGAYNIRPGAKVELNRAMAYASPKVRLSYSHGALTLDKGFNHETNINHLSSKMIMINGKEATERELKKLSAADIESMSVRSGDEVVKQYGEKAKDGVLFIETKKGK